ncbi:Sodium:alanine symporter, partial [gut metagenome]
MNNFLSHLNDFLYSYILIFLLAGSGIYFTIRTRFVQITLFKDAFLALKEKSSSEETTSGKPISSFQALMISTASRVGTGNIAGIATALAAGGPGSIFWMWLMAVIGGASAFVESTLAQVYKVKEGDSFRGGPSYYIERGLKKRWLGILFSILLICCFAYGFNGLQAYNISSSLEYYVKNYSDTILPTIVGILLAFLTAIVIFGGAHRISFITSV